MRCLTKFEWVKLLRSRLPEGKGIMSYWAKLAARVAFRKGEALYCGYINSVEPGMWVGGIVGLKSILGVKNRAGAVQVLDDLSNLGYIEYELDDDTKKLSIRLMDWVVKCSGSECLDGNVYTSEDYGFLCMPRNLTERLVDDGRVFGEADAWLDLWCHTIAKDQDNLFSFFAPMIRYPKINPYLTLETLGKRWRWEKTKVWRFFKKHTDVFALYRLPGSYGCLIFNRLYPQENIIMPTQEEVETLFRSGQLIIASNRVAVSEHIIRAYISPCRNCRKCDYDCVRSSISSGRGIVRNDIRGP